MQQNPSVRPAKGQNRLWFAKVGLVIAEASGQDFVCQALVEVRNSKDVPKFGETVKKILQTVEPAK